jgi:hypothetical protein
LILIISKILPGPDTGLVPAGMAVYEMRGNQSQKWTGSSDGEKIVFSMNQLQDLDRSTP